MLYEVITTPRADLAITRLVAETVRALSEQRWVPLTELDRLIEHHRDLGKQAEGSDDAGCEARDGPDLFWRGEREPFPTLRLRQGSPNGAGFEAGVAQDTGHCRNNFV